MYPVFIYISIHVWLSMRVPFPEAHKIHDLQALFLETISQFLGHAAVLKMRSPMALLPSWLSHGMTMGAKGQQHLQANPTATPSLLYRMLKMRNHILLVTSVFILLSESVCLQTYHCTATMCKSMCSNWVAYGRFSYFISGEQPAHRGCLQTRPSWH